MSHSGLTVHTPTTQSRLSASNRGFTLVEVVVALFIVLVLAAVALPSLSGYLQQKRIEATVTQLTEVAIAFSTFNNAVGNTYPGRLSELSQTLIASNSSYATGTDDSCGGVFTNGEKNQWDGSGPFVKFFIDRTSGMVTPIGQAADSLTRNPSGGGSGNLIINFINSVELADAVLLDQTADGANGSAAGYVRWGAAVNGVVTMTVWVPIGTDC
jgi:prepilin-type N-terminal cleavage/methylation domain-containing protein